MNGARIIQVGDLHFPEASGTRLADEKDTGLAEPLGRAAAPPPLTNVTRRLSRFIEETNGPLVLCGDITSHGDMVGYKQGVDYLIESLTLDDVTRWEGTKKLHAVPGNHDVDRAVAEQSGDSNLLAKFDPLDAIWQDADIDIVATRDPRVEECDVGGSRVCIIAMNSCIGCGEKRYLPRELADEILSAIKNRLNGQVEVPDLTSSWEQLDTPAFLERHITTAMEAVSNLSQSTLPILVAHHNLLPQTRNRYSIYGELINAGLARSRFTGARRSLLYLHGHIHDDPIETVQQYHPTGGRVVSIAAPELSRGFNLIDVEYAKSGVPLGCVVRAFRVRQHGDVDLQAEIRVALTPSGPRPDQHELISPLVRVLEGPTRMDEIRQSLEALRDRKPQRRTVGEAAREAEWLGLVEIRNRVEAYQHWQVEVTGGRLW